MQYSKIQIDSGTNKYSVKNLKIRSADPTRPAKIRQNRDPTRPDPRVHPTRGQLWIIQYFETDNKFRTRRNAAQLQPCYWLDKLIPVSVDPNVNTTLFYISHLRQPVTLKQLNGSVLGETFPTRLLEQIQSLSSNVVLQQKLCWQHHIRNTLFELWSRNKPQDTPRFPSCMTRSWPSGNPMQ